MFRKYAVVLSGLLAAALAPPAGAQYLDLHEGSGRIHWIELNGGFAVPTGDLSEVAKFGFDLGASATWMFSSTWGAGVDLGYHTWKGQDEAEPADGDLFFHATQFSGHGRLWIPTEGGVDPWLQAGLGLYRFHTKLERAWQQFDEESTETRVGFHAGAGFQLEATPAMSWGMGAQYQLIPDDEQPATFFNINLNVMFGIGAWE